ncbi:MAG: carbohydrate ABC transporter permease [Atribacterota bacterium]
MKQRFSSSVLYSTLITLLLVVVLIPIYWLIMPSFLPASEMFAFPPHLIPRSFTLKNYYDLIVTYPRIVTIDMLLYLRNSFLACGSASVIVLVISVLAGYALARFPLRGKETLRTTILLTQMMPAVLFFIPIYLFMKRLGLVNNLLALILMYPGMVAPFGTFISEAYIVNIPREIEESALLDGANTGTILLRIIFPLSAPMMVAILMYSFVWMWNDLIISLVLCHANEVRTASVGLFSFIGAATVEWGGLLAGTVLCILPPLLLFALFQKFIIQGILAGSLKA